MRFTSFAHALQSLRAVAPVWERIQRQRALALRAEGQEIVCYLKPNIDPAVLRALQEIVRDSGAAGVEDLYIAGHMALEGPKVYRPTDQECEALEQTEPRITLAEYRQPFPTMAVELPANYGKARSVPTPPATPWAPGRSRPLGVILRHEPELTCLFASIVWDDGGSIVRCVHALAGHPTIADSLFDDAPEPPGARPLTEDERRVTPRLITLAINAMLLLCHYGHRPLPPDNPSHAQRLERHLAAARKRRQGVEEAERELRLLPTVFAFAQDVTLRHQSRPAPHDGPENSTGRTLRPHWRRGHLRMQVCGAGRSQRKLLFVPPCLINPHLLTGPLAASVTTYRTTPTPTTAPTADDQTIATKGP